MGKLESLEIGNRTLYSTDYFSGNYNQELYLKRSVDDGSNKPKFYISAFTNINGKLKEQGYLYFYLDYETKKSYFIGLSVSNEYRNLNIASLLISNWIDLCLNNGYDFLGVNKKQRKPFLLYLLKTYGFEILNTSLYDIRNDVITICRNINLNDKRKFLLFKDSKHEKTFVGTNIFKNDNYKIIHNCNNIIKLDKIILSFQSAQNQDLNYELLNHDLAQSKVKTILSRHKR